MRVLIIGAGGTGKSVARGISRLRKVSEVFIYNRTLQSSVKAVKEINSPKAKAFSKDTSLNFDYLILTLCAVGPSERIKNIRESKDTYEVRQKELRINLLAVKNKISFFKNLPKKTKIIVITNPVDAIENYLKKKLPERKIFGFGLQLDVNRYSKYLSKKTTTIGIHGKTIPLLNLERIEDYDKLYKKADGSFLKYIKKNGLPYIIYKEEFKKYFKKLISKKRELIYTSARIDKPFYGIKNVSFGLPFYIKNGNIVGRKNIKLSIIEQERLKRDVKILKDSIKKYI